LLALEEAHMKFITSQRFFSSRRLFQPSIQQPETDMEEASQQLLRIKGKVYMKKICFYL